MTSGRATAADPSRLGWCRVVALVVLLAPALGLAQQAPPGASWGIEALMRELGQVQHAKANFVERKYLQMLDTPLELAGTLEYRAPDHLERHTLRPKPESFVVDGDRLTLENMRGQRRRLALQDHPVLWAFVESIRSTLKGDLTQLERFYGVALDGGADRWQLSLTPKLPKMSAIISLIRIGGSDGMIRRVEIQEARGDRSVMTVLEAGS